MNKKTYSHGSAHKGDRMQPMVCLAGGENYLNRSAIMEYWQAALDNTGCYADVRLHLFPSFNQISFEENLQYLPRKLHISFASPTEELHHSLQALAQRQAHSFIEFEGFHSTGGTDTMIVIPVDNTFLPTPSQAADVWFLRRTVRRRHHAKRGTTSPGTLHGNAPGL